MTQSHWTRAPIWVSGFRPFYLLGCLYAPLVLVGAAGAFGGLVNLTAADSTPVLWHGHEMIFGFASAIIIGTLLTALPSWAGTPEVHGGALTSLAGLWVIGRVALWASPWLPRAATAAADLLLMPALLALLAPGIWRAPNRYFRWLLPIVLALAAADAIYHAGWLLHDPALSRLGLKAGVYTIMVLFTLKGGVLTPTFTGNAIGRALPLNWRLEAAAAGSIAFLAVLDLAQAPAIWIGLAALACALVHAIRSARWRGWLVARQPLLLAMHLSFVWLVVAFILEAAARLTGLVPETSWLHIFTIGSLGMMMLGLMPRVVLRHTGRPLIVPASLYLAYAAMFAAVPLRLAADIQSVPMRLVAAAALLWAGAFAVFFVLFARVLIAPSLPRAVAPLQPATGKSVELPQGLE